MLGTVITMLVLLLVIGILIISELKNNYKNLNKEKVEINEDIWENIRTPLEMGYIFDGYLKKQHILGTLLYFIDKKYIIATPIYKDDKIVSYKLEKKDFDIYDSKTYTKMVDKNKDISILDLEKLSKKNISIASIYVINRIVFNDQKTVTISDIESFYDNKDCKGLETEELKNKYHFANILLNRELECCGLKEVNEKIFTEFGKLKYEECKNFYNKLKDSYINERNINGMIVWGENLAFGVAVSICKIALEEIDEIYNMSDRGYYE